MATKVPYVEGLHEIPHGAWIITSGNRAYIYSGVPSGAKEAMKFVTYRISENAGNTPHIKKVA
jgi:hypothetical protein